MAGAVVEDVSLADVLRSHRVRVGWTQQELADFSTVSIRAIRDLERGATLAPRRETLRLIADALRLDGPARSALESATVPGAAVVAGTPPDAAVDQQAPSLGLVGRTAALQRLRALLGPNGERLVGVTGVPGVGKTRLARAVAAAAERDRTLVLWHRLSRGDSLDWTGPLGPLDRLTAASVHELASAAVPAPRGGLHRLAAMVGAAPALLVLDGVDRPLNELALGRLLRDCRGLRVLYTSGRPQRLGGERVVPLAPLVLPGIAGPGGDALLTDELTGHDLTADDLRSNDAVQVLLQTADDTLLLDDPEDAAAVAQVCWRLDGLPLALRQAAPLLTLYGPRTLHRCLAQDLFGTLGAHEEPGREPQLADRLRRLVDDLGPAEREVLTLVARLGPTTTVAELSSARGLELTECGALVDRLLRRGLVRREGPGRFRLLNLVREVMRR